MEISDDGVLCIYHSRDKLEWGCINPSYNGDYSKFVYVDRKVTYSSILQKLVDVSYKVTHDKDLFLNCLYHNGRVHTLVSITDDDDVYTMMKIGW